MMTFWAIWQFWGILLTCVIFRQQPWWGAPPVALRGVDLEDTGLPPGVGESAWPKKRPRDRNEAPYTQKGRGKSAAALSIMCSTKEKTRRAGPILDLMSLRPSALFYQPWSSPVAGLSPHDGVGLGVAQL